MSEQLSQPDPINLAEARLDTDYMNAMQSAEWHGKLSNPGTISTLGRRMLNGVGIETGAQKAMQQHENIMSNYAESAGIHLSEVSSVTPDQHNELRAAAVEQGLDEGTVENRIVDGKLDVQIRPMGTPRQLGVIDSIRRMQDSNPSDMPDGVKYLGPKR